MWVLPTTMPNVKPDVYDGTPENPGNNVTNGNTNSARSYASLAGADFLNSVPDYILGNTLSGATANQLEALYDYKRNKDLQTQSENFNASQNQIDRVYNAEQAALDRAFSAEEALKTRDFNSNEAKLQRDWETEMSNSAYRRAAADISALGFNPAVLFSNYGQMASTPSGHAASGSNASLNGGARSSGRGSSSGHTGSASSNGIGSLLGSALMTIGSIVVAGIKASSAVKIAGMEKKYASRNLNSNINTNHTTVYHKYQI